MLFIGHTRFSLFSPESGAWIASNGSKFRTVEDYRDYLFSAERMDPRCEIFFNYTLPMLAIASEEYVFGHVVSFSDTLPDRYQTRLSEAAKNFPFLILDRVEAGGGMMNVARAARRLMASAGMPLTTVYGSLRLDDDDILSADYFEQMARHITLDKVGHVISLSRGVTAMHAGGRFYYARDAVLPLHSKGHLGVCRFDEAGNFHAPVGGPHNEADKVNPVIIDGSKFSHIWVRSTTQDTSLYQLGKSKADMLDRIYIDMNQYPVLEADVDKAFPALAGLLYTEKPPAAGGS